MQKTLEIVYDLTPDDITRSQRYGLPQGWILIVVFLAVFIGSTSMTMLPSVLRTGDWRRMAIDAGVPLIAVAVLYPAMLWLRGRRQSAALSSKERRTVRIAPEVFQIQDDVESRDVQWNGFAKLDADKDLLYFVRTDRTVYGIPKRAFSSSEDANAFYQTARDYWQSAKDGAPAPPPTRSSAWPPPPGR